MTPISGETHPRQGVTPILHTDGGGGCRPLRTGGAPAGVFLHAHPGPASDCSAPDSVVVRLDYAENLPAFDDGY